MNFLALCKRLHLVLRIGDERPGTQPETVVGQESVIGEMVEWVRAAHSDLCVLRKGFLFMQADGTLPLVEGGRMIAASAARIVLPAYKEIQPFVDDDGMFVLMTPDGEPDAAEMPVRFVPAQRFFGHHDMAPIPVGMPTRFTVNESGTLVFNSTADRDYTIRTQYRKSVVDLEADDDEPMLPEEHHSAIIAWAVVNFYCANHDGTREMLLKYDPILRRELTRLYNAQLPDFGI